MWPRDSAKVSEVWTRKDGICRPLSTPKRLQTTKSAKMCCNAGPARERLAMEALSRNVCVDGWIQTPPSMTSARCTAVGSPTWVSGAWGELAAID